MLCDLYVAMYDMLAVRVRERCGELLHVTRHCVLGQRSASLELLIQLSVLRVLQHEIHAARVEEVCVQSQYVPMPQMALNLHLAPQLRLDPVPVQLLQVQHLHRAYKLRRAVARQIHSTVLATAQWTTDVERGDAQSRGEERTGASQGRLRRQATQDGGRQGGGERRLGSGQQGRAAGVVADGGREVVVVGRVVGLLVLFVLVAAGG